MNQRVIISTHLESELVSALSECEHDKLFVLTDTTTPGSVPSGFAEILLHEGSHR